MFNVGDRVKCIDASGQSLLIKGNYYIIKKMNSGSRLIGFDFDDDSSWYAWRFEIDIKVQRKEKLEKICLSQEIE